MSNFKDYAIDELTRIGMYNSGDEMKERLIKDYDYVCDDEYRKTDEYQRYCSMYRVEEWEVEE